MKKNADRFGQALLLLIGGGLILSGGSCVISVGANVFALLGLPFIGLGVWIVSLAMKEEAKVDNEENNGQGAEKEKQ